MVTLLTDMARCIGKCDEGLQLLRENDRRERLIKRKGRDYIRRRYEGHRCGGTDTGSRGTCRWETSDIKVRERLMKGREILWPVFTFKILPFDNKSEMTVEVG